MRAIDLGRWRRCGFDRDVGVIRHGGGGGGGGGGEWIGEVRFG